MNANQLKALKAHDPDQYRATLARIEAARLGWNVAAIAPQAPAPDPAPVRRRSLESLAEAFRRGMAADNPEGGLSASLGDYRRSLIYACTGLRASQLAALPLCVYRWVDDDDATEGRALDLRQPRHRAGKPAPIGVRGPRRRSLVEAEGVPLLSMLARPNEDWSFPAILRQVETSLCLVGQAHIVLHRDARQRLSGLSFVKHDRLEIIRPGPGDAARTVAGWQLDGARGQRLAPADVIWLRYPDPENPDYGALAPAQIAALGSEAYRSAIKSNLDIFRKGLRAAAIITPPEEMAPPGWDQIDELQADVDRQLRGAANNHNAAVMPYRFGVERLDITPRDAEFVSLLEFAIEDVARAFSVPIEMVGGTRRTYQNAEAADRAFWQRCLAPEAEWIAGELTRRLIPAAGLSEDYVIGFDLSDVVALQDDENAAWARDREALGIGALRVNEWRTDHGLPELPESSALRVGDVNAALQVMSMLGNYQLSEAQALGLLVSVVGLTEDQARAVIADGPPEPLEPPADALAPEGGPDGGPGGENAPEAAQDAARAAVARAVEVAALTRGTVEWGSGEHRRILDAADTIQAPHAQAFAEGVSRIMERQRDSVLAKLRELDARAATGGQRKGPDADDLDKLFSSSRWVVETRKALRDAYRAAARAAGQAALKGVGAAIAWTGNNKPTTNALMRREQRFAESVTDTTWQRLRRQLAEGIEAGEGIPDLAARVERVMGDRIKSSAETIARTEVHGTFEQTGVLAIQTAADELGLTYTKEWVTALDERVRPDHEAAHGQTVGISEEYEVGGARGMAPGEMGDPAQDINCRCTSRYSVKDSA